MSQSNSENAIEELDLVDIFSLFKRWFFSVLALFFKAIDFLLKFWWVIILLIVIGVVAGKLTMSPPGYSATIVVKTNFDSQALIYNAIEQLEAKIADQDALFISTNKLSIDNKAVASATISPIIDVTSLLDGISKSDSRSFGSVLKEFTVENDEELFASERFYSNYKYHKLEVGLVGQDPTLVQNVLDYVNSRPSLGTIKKGYVANLEDHINANEKTLSQINTIIENYADNIDVVSKNAKNLSYYNNENNLNLNGILDLKNKLVLETEELKNEQITTTDALVALSDIQIVTDTGLTDKKYIFYPLVLVFLFLIAAGIRFTYGTLRKKLKEENFLN